MGSMRKWVAVGLLGVLGIVLAVVAPAFACAPGAGIRTSAPSGPAGSKLSLSLYGFSPSDGMVQIGWSNGVTVEVLANVPPGSTGVVVTVPAGPPDVYYFTGRQWSSSTGALMVAVVTPFEVLPASGSTPPVGAPARPSGYRLAASDGGVFAFGADRFLGSMGGRAMAQPIVGMASTPSGQGYWLVAADGGIFAFGDAGFFGSTGGMRLSKPIVGMAPTPTGHGYWLAASDGGVFAFGDAGFVGSLAGQGMAIVGMTTRPDGYVLAAANGTVWDFVAPGAVGDGTSRGAGAFNAPLARPAVGIATSRLGGYWLAAADGGIFTLSGAPFYGSAAGAPLARPVVGVAGTGGPGYWLTASDGGIFAFGDAPYLGSLGGVRLAQPIVGMAS